MDLDFFKKVRILDGGMGQELLARGLISYGTLWSASALIDEKNHQLLIDTHLSFIESGADVIVTNTFTSKKIRMSQNKVDNLFKYANLKACKLALKAKEISKKNILIAGSIPAQNNTYEVDKRDKNIIKENFYDQISIIYPYIDFFYLDVISSGREIEIALDIIEKLNKPVLIGLYIKKNGKLPSGESITEIIKKFKSNNWLGVILACVSPEIIQKTINELQKTGLPFGFKANLWKSEPLPVHKFNKSKFNQIGENPNMIMGKREDVTGKVFYNFVKKTTESGATILGGCCETNTSHIKEISKLK